MSSSLPKPTDKIAAACRRQALLAASRLADMPNPLEWLQQKVDPDLKPPEGLQEAQFLAIIAGAHQANRHGLLLNDNFQKVLRYYGGKLQEVYLRHFSQDAVVSTILDLVAPPTIRETILVQTSAMYVAGTFNAVADNIREFPDCREFLAQRLPPGMAATAVPAKSDSN